MKYEWCMAVGALLFQSSQCLSANIFSREREGKKPIFISNEWARKKNEEISHSDNDDDVILISTPLIERYFPSFDEYYKRKIFRWEQDKLALINER